MAKQRARSTIPAFRSETEERRFWETHDTSPFVDWSKARVAMFPDLKPSAIGALPHDAAHRAVRPRRSRSGR